MLLQLEIWWWRFAIWQFDNLTAVSVPAPILGNDIDQSEMRIITHGTEK